MIKHTKNFFTSTRRAKELAAENSRLQSYIDELVKEVNNVKSSLSIANQNLANVATAYKADGVELNYIIMNAFSIERVNYADSGITTVIGYYNRANEVKEWKVACDDVIHKRLCDEFRDYSSFIQGMAL